MEFQWAQVSGALTSRTSVELIEYAIELAELQHAGYSSLVQTARPLTMQLAAF